MVLRYAIERSEFGSSVTAKKIFGLFPVLFEIWAAR